MGKNPPELYYEVLNIAKDTTSPQEIRAAYRGLVRQWHPDKHPPSSKTEAEARFKAITQAYEALLDQQEDRAVFRARNVDEDGRRRSCASRAENAAGGGLPAMAPRAPCKISATTSSTRKAPAAARECSGQTKVYSSTDVGLGGRRAFAEFSSYVVRKAPPLECKVECTLEELCAGCKKEVKYTRDVVTKNGLIAKKEVTQIIRVKPGWKKGTKVTFEGMGNERPGCLPGDAVFTVSIRKHKAFKRQGDDLVLKAEVPLVSALTGWSFSFRLMSGEKVSWSFRDEVICPGYEKVVKGEGMPVAGGHRGARGDLRVKFDVVFPENLSEERRTGLAEILRGCA
ncbi:dnaJ protein homolog 1 [Brachypodium distachyon]|uniref:J domain-containing protein n=1 Tax=Brachypodium distachyon TaxID=15368 RepID=A0A0Q3G483_BRADI|nr:dnaJ protein homolog 1 [Brachypodium distachyon]XP_024315892.1 dnaJ protein homolog 1 [Brachypodium distachyon]KQK06120.1 hypothetical protein BRADI_2g24680v3 [Brachypodium distachyon]PNT71195.1 hypothetical protein BRADI_2g24680v3 [Brachypodium distachyon]|eukprot:XP_003568401.1 dnaJ protein homolog 1 [Brachypodium distachyon]